MVETHATLTTRCPAAAMGASTKNRPRPTACRAYFPPCNICFQVCESASKSALPECDFAGYGGCYDSKQPLFCSSTPEVALSELWHTDWQLALYQPVVDSWKSGAMAATERA